jgi:hypothetical protein
MRNQEMIDLQDKGAIAQLGERLLCTQENPAYCEMSLDPPLFDLLLAYSLLNLEEARAYKGTGLPGDPAKRRGNGVREVR